MRNRYPANPGAAVEYYSRADLQSLLEAMAIPLRRIPAQSGFAQGAAMMLEMLATAVGVDAPGIANAAASHVVISRKRMRLPGYEEPELLESLADGEWTTFP